jgi:hypothetical protein
LLRTLLARGRLPRLELGFIVGGLLVRVVFWQVTDRKFEDGLITAVHARNATHGIGLTHHPFEPVTHGFTSAISVLVPLAGELLDFLPKFDGLVALRLASLAAFVVTILAAKGIADDLRLGRWPRVLLYGYLAFSFNHIFYGMAGMETQMAVAILLCAVLAGLRERPVAAGLLCGLCLLARPDFALFVGPAVLGWLIRDRRAALKVIGLSTLVVLPWIVFTTLYYGSPIPNTIEAKALRYPTRWPHSLSPSAWWDFLASSVSARQGWMWRTLSPFWEHAFVQDAPFLPVFAKWFAAAFVSLALVGAIDLWRRVPGMRPTIVFAVIFVAYRMLSLPASYYDWYYPPLTAIVALLAASAVDRLARVSPRIPVVAGATVTGAFALALPALFVLEERYQHSVEDKARYPLGLYMRYEVPKGSVVTSESAGYVGYYSGGNIKLWDYPGLTSKEALNILRVLNVRRSSHSLTGLVDAARPDYAIFRPGELALFRRVVPDTAALYQEVARFVAPVKAEHLSWGGVKYYVPDLEFIVMKRVRGSLGGVERARALVER